MLKRAASCRGLWHFLLGGGGATDIRHGGTGLADRMLVAVGGGGSSSSGEGTPTAGGAHPVTETASNGTAPDDAVDVTLAVTQSPYLADTAIPHATAGQAHSYQPLLVGHPPRRCR